MLVKAGDEQSWSARVVAPQGRPVVGRVCAILRAEEPIRIARAGIRQTAKRVGRPVEPQIPACARYVIVFTMCSASDSTGAEVLEWDRRRWQVEMVFKRFRQPADLGHLQARRRERQSVPVRQAALGAAGREADRPGDRHSPLGIPLGAHSISCCIGSQGPHWQLTQAIGTWNAFSEEFGDPPRLRLGQLPSYFNYSQTS